MISIRRERPEDTAAIRAINEAAFAQSAEADIVDALRDSCPDILSLVAETDDGIVGHILFSPVTIEDGPQSRQGMGLAPMAVMPNRQRRGIGSKLIDAGLTGVARYRDELDAAMSYLVWVEGRSPEEAIGLIHRGRPDAVPAWEAHHGCREDRVVRYRPHIQERAYALSQSRPTEHGDAQRDWRQAEAEVIRSALTAIEPPDDANGG